MTNTKTSVILGAGPMGRAIATRLAAQERSVVVVTRDGRSIDPNIESRSADLISVEQTTEACAGAGAIYLCAAPPYHQWPQTFPALQNAAIEAAASTGAVLVAVENLYGYGVAGNLDETMPLAAQTRKGKLRAQMAKDLLAAHQSGKARCVAGRSTDFFGPGVVMSALGEHFWTAVLKNKAVNWVGDPDVLHSFAFVPDLAEAFITLAATEKMWGQAWHLPALPPITIRELCQKIVSNDNTRPRIRQTPSWLLRAIGLFQPAATELIEMRYMFDEPFVIDHSRFSQQTNPLNMCSWEEAIRETSDWWQAR